MRRTRILDALSIRPRYARSIHVERDFLDPGALEGYVVTPQVRDSLQRLLAGLAPGSTQRAWRITGDYGSGKSSFALALARILSGQHRGLPAQLQRRAISGMARGIPKILLPVLVVGSRVPLTQSVLAALARSLRQEGTRGRRPQLLDRIDRALAARPTSADDLVLDLIGEAAAYVCETERAGGLLLILDELGKFLEHAALRPDQQDIYFLQRLAENAARSGDVPVFVLGLLHQGFSAYAAHVSELARREWEKVAGRYSEVLFNQPLEQLAQLAAQALGVRSDRLPSAVQRRAKSAMQSTLDLGWYGPLANRAALLDLAPRLYPLHPTVLPVASKIFTRFGQNERSFFGFLLSDEPLALRAFSERTNSLGEFYRLHNLYDYARASMGLVLATASYRSHWNLIDSLVASFPVEDTQSLHVLKTVGVINLIDDQGILATDRSIETAVAGWSELECEATKRATAALQKGKRVLYHRGAAGGLCLWPYTSVNVEQAYQDARRASDLPAKLAPLLGSYMDVSPFVARRHYIETGNFRVFTVSQILVHDVATKLATASTADGEIVIVMPETAEERQAAIAAASDPASAARPDILIAVTQPLSTLNNLLTEVRCWEWVAANTPELSGDAFAAEEVSRQISASHRIVAERVRDLVGIGPSASAADVAWYRASKRQSIVNGREFVTLLSTICDELYPKAPIVQNELINRNILSSAAAAARMRLVERLLSSASEPYLGLDEHKSPPEKSMYLSVLERGRLHRRVRGVWSIAAPPPNDDPLRLRPTFQRVRELLEAKPDARVPVSQILRELAMPPFGVRAGLAPLLLAVLIAAHDDELAVYENDTFLERVGSLEIQRLIKAPESFSMQLCKIAGVRAAVFDALLRILRVECTESQQPTLLNVVRPLCVFASKLPSYTAKTRFLSNISLAVRNSLLNAREPATLLFVDLPKACGFEPFFADSSKSSARVRAFAATLRGAIDELRAAYPKLLESMRAQLTSAFDPPGSPGDLRKTLATAAENLAFRVADIRLKGFCLRLADHTLGNSEWLEALGAFICAKPPSRWSDLDVEFFNTELARLVALFRRVQATSFGESQTSNTAAVRIAVTFSDGSDVAQVVQLVPDEEPKAAELEAAISRILAADGRIAIVAASRALKRALTPREATAASGLTVASTEVRSQ